jgi:diguanylate cyclase (GGDEF)-like protein
LSSLYCLGLQTEQQLWGAVLFSTDGIHADDALLDSVILASNFATGAIQNAFQFGQTRLQTITDPLTGLYNKRYFKQSLPHEIARAQRYSKPMTLVMIDIDHFKQLNDIYGHPKGDQVLSTLGSTLHETLRSTDFSFRYGGEEFAVILPETRIEHSFTVAEHLRSTLQERLSLQLNSTGQGKVTASLGLAAFPHDGATSDTLLKHADHCLYKAKHQGRNRVYWEMNTMEISK